MGWWTKEERYKVVREPGKKPRLVKTTKEEQMGRQGIKPEKKEKTPEPKPKVVYKTKYKTRYQTKYKKPKTKYVPKKKKKKSKQPDELDWFNPSGFKGGFKWKW